MQEKNKEKKNINLDKILYTWEPKLFFYFFFFFLFLNVFSSKKFDGFCVDQSPLMTIISYSDII